MVYPLKPGVEKKERAEKQPMTPNKELIGFVQNKKVPILRGKLYAFHRVAKMKIEEGFKIKPFDERAHKNLLKKTKLVYLTQAGVMEDWSVFIQNEEAEPIHSEKCGRNDKCQCGSGLKYKKCCLDKDEAGVVEMAKPSTSEEPAKAE